MNNRKLILTAEAEAVGNSTLQIGKVTEVRTKQRKLVRAKQALDALALALTEHGHKWTRKERRLYEVGIRAVS